MTKSPAPELHKNHDIYFVPGLRRGLHVLEILANEARPMAVADIAKRLDLTRSSVFRLTYTLLTNPGGLIPVFVVNMSNTIAIPKLFEAVRKRSAGKLAEKK